MKRLQLVLVIFSVAVSSAFGQTSTDKPRLGVLPFAGGADGDGETVATLFSFQPDIQTAFTVVPRTGAVNAVMEEQNFQLSGYTDSDTIAGLGRMLNADFVVSGHIRSLGNRNLVIATIVDVESFEQLAGVYREYRNTEEIPGLLPDITRKLIEATKRDTSMLPRLAVAPFSINNDEGVDADEAEVLAQILAIEIANTTKYAVLPRTTTMQAALKELEFQMSGYTAEEEAKALGRAINAEFLLSGEVRGLGAMNMFTAQILNVEDGSLLAGDSREYLIIDDGIKSMEDLALLLTDRAATEAMIAARARSELRASLAKLWSIGVSAGSCFSEPWLIGTIRGTIAPIKYCFLELGFDYGSISGYNGISYHSLCPWAHLAFYMPVIGIGGFYAGAGGSYLMAEYGFPQGDLSEKQFCTEFIAGFNLFDFLDISYTLRTTFKNASNKVSLGYFYRFK